MKLVYLHWGSLKKDRFGQGHHHHHQCPENDRYSRPPDHNPLSPFLNICHISSIPKGLFDQRKSIHKQLSLTICQRGLAFQC